MKRKVQDSANAERTGWQARQEKTDRTSRKSGLQELQGLCNGITEAL